MIDLQNTNKIKWKKNKNKQTNKQKENKIKKQANKQKLFYTTGTVPKSTRKIETSTAHIQVHDGSILNLKQTCSWKKNFADWSIHEYPISRCLFCCMFKMQMTVLLYAESDKCIAVCSIFKQLHNCVFNIHMSILWYAQYSANSIVVCSIFRTLFCCKPNRQLIVLMYDVCSIFRWSYCCIFNIRMLVFMYALLNIQPSVLLCC